MFCTTSLLISQAKQLWSCYWNTTLWKTRTPIKMSLWEKYPPCLFFLLSASNWLMLVVQRQLMVYWHWGNFIIVTSLYYLIFILLQDVQWRSIYCSPLHWSLLCNSKTKAYAMQCKQDIVYWCSPDTWNSVNPIHVNDSEEHIVG